MSLKKLSDRIIGDMRDQIEELFRSHNLSLTDEEIDSVISIVTNGMFLIEQYHSLKDEQKAKAYLNILLSGVVNMMKVIKAENA